MNITAFDLSLTATGFACAGWQVPHPRSGVLNPNGRRGFVRLEWIRSAVLELAHGADLVVIEGYSYASKGRAILDAAELGGVIRMALFDLGRV